MISVIYSVEVAGDVLVEGTTILHIDVVLVEVVSVSRYEPVIHHIDIDDHLVYLDGCVFDGMSNVCYSNSIMLRCEISSKRGINRKCRTNPSH